MNQVIYEFKARELVGDWNSMVRNYNSSSYNDLKNKMLEYVIELTQDKNSKSINNKCWDKLIEKINEERGNLM